MDRLQPIPIINKIVTTIFKSNRKFNESLFFIGKQTFLGKENILGMKFWGVNWEGAMTLPILV